MRKDAWNELPQHRYHKVWDRFDAAFAFNPSVYKRDWPSFVEPAPSLTWDISHLLGEFAPWHHPRSVPYNLALLRALQECVPEDEPVLALDWQHASYDFYPHRLVHPADPSVWCIPALPSGEYHLFVTRDHRLGSLGHPWEQTLCIFGEGFVDAYLRFTPLPADKIIRRKMIEQADQARRPKRQAGQRCPRPRRGKS